MHKSVLTTSFFHAIPTLVLLAVASSVLANNESPSVSTKEQMLTPVDKLDKTKGNGCFNARASDEWIDGVRASTHSRLCNTASWLDGLFGDEEPFPGSDFRGKFSLGFKYDEIGGIDPRVRVRIKTDLPNVSKRFNAFLGRVEEDSYIANTEVREDRLNNVGFRSTNDDESEWLVGLGYRAPSKDNNGFDVSVGAKLSGGVSPYTKLTHRHLFGISESTMLRATQTAFWRKKDGFGISSNAELTKFVSDDDIWVTSASVKFTEEADQLEWFTDTTWHHTLNDKQGISSSAYVRGEQDSPVSIPEYGLTFTYIRPVLRDWLYMETGVDFRWERDQPDSAYKSAVRIGLQFEMLLGDYYNRKHRSKRPR